MNPFAEAGVGLITWAAVLLPMVACYRWRQRHRSESVIAVAERITAAPMVPAEVPVQARDSEPFESGIFALGGTGTPRIHAGEVET